MKHSLLLVLALLAAPAGAAPACIPGIYGPEWPGAERQPPTRFNAGWAAWGWCRPPGATAPVIVYRMCVHGADCPASVGAFLGGVLQDLGLTLLSSDPAAAYGAWLDAHPPTWECGNTDAPVGTQRAALCTEIGTLQRAQLARFYAAPASAPASAPPPAPPASAPTGYVVTRTAVYPLNADGTRSVTPLPATVPLGAACDCATRQVLGLFGARYCAVSVPGVTQPVVASCGPQR